MEPAMPYPIDAEVLVTTIGKVGRVVAIGRGGRYRVLVGGIEVACREGELQAPSPAIGRRRARHSASVPEAETRQRPVSDAVSGRLGSIDLHGATVEEALRAVEARLDEAIRSGLDHLDVIHGIGTGRIRQALHRFLRDIGAVRHFEVTPDNPGVTRVYF
jgi:DNA mismatch repair protein MutS2